MHCGCDSFTSSARPACVSMVWLWDCSSKMSRLRRSARRSVGRPSFADYSCAATLSARLVIKDELMHKSTDCTGNVLTNYLPSAHCAWDALAWLRTPAIEYQERLLTLCSHVRCVFESAAHLLTWAHRPKPWRIHSAAVCTSVRSL
jgi:hypothetical protein